MIRANAAKYLGEKEEMKGTLEWILLVVCLVASGVGALVGAGGGVIIKPILDFMGVMPVPVISFCSGCTVLAMAGFSLLMSRKSEVRVEWKISTPLAAGAVAGGLMGKALFEWCQRHFPNTNLLGAVQSGCLLLLTLGVLLYVCNKGKLRAKNVQNAGAILVIGCGLGTVSAFLGIGGGPFNLAVLYFFFSMQAKQAAINSLYVILFSQGASLIMTFATRTVPEFQWTALLAMITGGVGGAFFSRIIGRRMNNAGVEKVLQGMTVVIILLCGYNMVQYLL